MPCNHASENIRTQMMSKNPKDQNWKGNQHEADKRISRLLKLESEGKASNSI
jgi:hypothetical protein